MRTFIELIALVSQDADQKRKLLDIDTAFDDTDALTSSTFNSAQMIVAAGATNVAVPFGGVTNPTLLLVVAYNDISVSLDGGSPILITHTPAVDTATVLSNVQKYDQPGLLLLRGRITSLLLNNPSATATANVLVAVVGEAI